MAVIRNTNTKIILRLPDLSDRELVGRSASLNDHQILELSRLETGVAAVYQNNWLEPVLCHIHPCKNDEKPFVFDNIDCKDNDNEIKEKIIDYVMLPVPKKLEINSNEISKLEKSIYTLQLASDTKVDLMRYLHEKNPDNIQKLRSKIIYNIFNSENAMMLSNTEKHDMNSWYNMMLDKLVPSVETLDRLEQDKILAIITDEHAKREKTPESIQIKNDLLKYIQAHLV